MCMYGSRVSVHVRQSRAALAVLFRLLLGPACGGGDDSDARYIYTYIHTCIHTHSLTHSLTHSQFDAVLDKIQNNVLVLRVLPPRIELGRERGGRGVSGGEG